jgi:uncharacterized protein YbaR (Trm112 family)
MPGTHDLPGRPGTGGAMISKELLDILVCPACKGDLEFVPEPPGLICHACRLRYRIEDDIPIMLIDEALPLENK